jgi:hypothetical protein
MDIPGISGAPTPPQSDISVVTAGRKRLATNGGVRPTTTTVKPSNKARDKRVEAPEVAPHPSLAPMATPAKMALTEAADNKKRKKAMVALLKAAPTLLSRKASPTNPTRGRTARPTVVSSEVFIETLTR